jgi:hypothetical protein
MVEKLLDHSDVQKYILMFRNILFQLNIRHLKQSDVTEQAPNFTIQCFSLLL